MKGCVCCFSALRPSSYNTPIKRPPFSSRMTLTGDGRHGVLRVRLRHGPRHPRQPPGRCALFGQVDRHRWTDRRTGGRTERQTQDARALLPFLSLCNDGRLVKERRSAADSIGGVDVACFVYLTRDRQHNATQTHQFMTAMASSASASSSSGQSSSQQPYRSFSGFDRFHQMDVAVERFRRCVSRCVMCISVCTL